MKEKILVAYFSATGTTAKAAKVLAKALGADIYEIRPETPYTAADLNWSNSSSRSSREMNDTASRPPVNGEFPDTRRYGSIFVGFPKL